MDTRTLGRTGLEMTVDEVLSDCESPTAFLLRGTIPHPQMHPTIVATRDLRPLAETLRSVEAGPLAGDVNGTPMGRRSGVYMRPGNDLRRVEGPRRS